MIDGACRAQDAPGLGLISRATPDYNGPTFREGLEYVLSFFWKPPILIAWKPRAVSRPSHACLPPPCPARGRVCGEHVRAVMKRVARAWVSGRPRNLCTLTRAGLAGP